MEPIAPVADVPVWPQADSNGGYYIDQDTAQKTFRLFIYLRVYIESQFARCGKKNAPKTNP